MYRELKTILGGVKNQWLRALIDRYFNDPAFEEAFCRHSAAKTIHHSFVGGLCEHTLSVVKLCEFYCTAYPYLNHDLLITAAAFHDVGKLKEISNFPANDYTDDGQLLGHIVMGCELIGSACRRIQGFPHRLLSELQHCILAHHGEYEYGSPKKPALAEAMALNLADNTDAKLENHEGDSCCGQEQRIGRMARIQPADGLQPQEDRRMVRIRIGIPSSTD